MYLIAGLGNPGPEYAFNRHNVGFMYLDTLSRQYPVKASKRHGSGYLTELNIPQFRVLLLKPLTYMNRSGLSIADVLRFYKIPIGNLLVIHDDLDLKPYQIKIKCGGGHGGHNGLKSLDAHIGCDYWRLRLGIGHPGHRDAVTGYVLGNFSKAEHQDFEHLFVFLHSHIHMFWQQGGDALKSQIERANLPNFNI